MYYLKSEQSFDAAHILAGYEGRCRNIHGHRWRVIIEVKSLTLQSEKQSEGMIVDFAQLKEDIKEEVDFLDHALIIERNTLKISTYEALQEEGFRLIELDFRPTAERLSKYFYDKLVNKGYQVKSATIYETPNNCASYEEDSDVTV
ncbi:6-pyruvoyl trahydropterin synthase family protein [Anaerocolumna sp. MB42-C2]|uniref:6-pyruvoyl trahydropterin synthase family protein n=1 Tax=Anaerocolumna sp. MB42-C2 TaxID=3070997 RepID=UPI0027DF282F|nr:6-carboxytetrahydropterin synthase [Anaerocolumna sp. MB42-C2]WMJ89709.1 6-carboxytetrahydropterin synthase [Anaerocolumna sp. MB42-C2]